MAIEKKLSAKGLYDRINRQGIYKQSRPQRQKAIQEIFKYFAEPILASNPNNEQDYNDFLSQLEFMPLISDSALDELTRNGCYNLVFGYYLFYLINVHYQSHIQEGKVCKRVFSTLNKYYGSDFALQFFALVKPDIKFDSNKQQIAEQLTRYTEKDKVHSLMELFEQKQYEKICELVDNSPLEYDNLIISQRLNEKSQNDFAKWLLETRHDDEFENYTMSIDKNVLYQAELVQSINNIEKAFVENEYGKCRKLFAEGLKRFGAASLEKLRIKCEQDILKKCDILLQTDEFSLSDHLYNANSLMVEQNKYLNLKLKYFDEDKYIEAFIDSAFDEVHLFQEKFNLSEKKIFELKINAYQEIIYRLTNEQIKDDLEKAAALAIESDDLLVAARAGSGKTTLLACKTVDLINRQGIRPDEIMILAFNKKAAEEIKGRIQNDFALPEFKNARTFHSLAYQLLKPSEKIIYDQPGMNEEKTLSGVVQDIFNTMLNESSWVSSFFSNFFTKHYEDFIHKINYIELVRQPNAHVLVPFMTMAGQKTKRLSEKFIADFFFEHEIYYDHDFELRGKFDLSSLGETDRKGYYYSTENFQFRIYSKKLNTEYNLFLNREGLGVFKKGQVEPVNTYLFDEDIGRDDIFALMASVCKAISIPVIRISEQRLREKLMQHNIASFSTRLAQFIQKCKQNSWTTWTLADKIDSYITGDYQEKLFLKLAKTVYVKFEQYLKARHSIDFYDLIRRSTVNIDNGMNTEISIDDDIVDLKKLKYLMIDEYQDFSSLFFSLVKAIRKVNPQLKLICVGDDWQAINAFAGSDLKFFQKFSSYFPRAKTVEMRNNYRSKNVIVDFSNIILGDSATAISTCLGGVVNYQSVSGVTMDYNSVGDRKISFVKKGQGFSCNNLILGKYLKVCLAKIRNFMNTQPDGHIAILSRTNLFYGKELYRIKQKLVQECFDDEVIKWVSEHVEVSSIHKYKGREADFVIILAVNEMNFPLIHPDWKLFQIFGETIDDIVEQEKHLFYVAITRAKTELLMLYEKSKLSEYVPVKFFNEE